MSNQTSGQLHARIGSENKQDLSDLANDKGITLQEAAKEAVDRYIKEERGLRVSPANISRLSVWDQYAVIMYGMAGMSAVLTLAGFDMMIYTIGFALLGVMGWAAEYRTNGSVGVPKGEQA